MPTKAEIIDFLVREFPQSKCIVEEVGDRSATVSHPIGPAQLRPGDTVSGPLLMAVADVALYSDRKEEMVAHAVGTYSIPPNRTGQ
jgi:acyl-coenzyme A thioesterase PaaI-like protein